MIRVLVYPVKHIAAAQGCDAKRFSAWAYFIASTSISRSRYVYSLTVRRRAARLALVILYFSPIAQGNRKNRRDRLRKRLRSLPFLLAVFCCLLGITGIVWGYHLYRISGVVIPVGSQKVDLESASAGHLTAGQSYTVTQLPPGVVFERCVTLPSDDTLSYSFKADQPVVFDVHYHRDALVSYARRKRTVISEAGQYDSTSLRDYCLTWHNTSRKAIRLSWRYQAIPSVD